MSRRVRRWLWRNWPDWMPGSYSHPRLSRFLFCHPCSPMRDMCNNPDHDFCALCGRSMPGAYTASKDGA